MAITTIDPPSNSDPDRLHFRHSEVRSSSIAGVGVHATRAVPKGSIWSICTPSNTLEITEHTYAHIRSAAKTYPEWAAFLYDITKDAYYSFFKNVLCYSLDNDRFTNHSEAATFDYVEWGAGEGVFACRSKQDIEAGQEVFEDYRELKLCPWGYGCEQFVVQRGPLPDVDEELLKKPAEVRVTTAQKKILEESWSEKGKGVFLHLLSSAVRDNDAWVIKVPSGERVVGKGTVHCAGYRNGVGGVHANGRL